MNDFEINGADINGTREVFFPASTASVVFQSTLDGRRGVMGAGLASVELQSDAIPQLRVRLESDAELVIDAAGELGIGLGLTGSAALELDAEGDGTRRTFGEGDATLAVEADGQGLLGVYAQGSATLTVDATLDVLSRVLGEGTASIQATATGGGYSRVRGEGAAEVRMDATGEVICWVLGESAASIETRGTGETLLGIALAGSSLIEFEVTGDGRLSEDTVFAIEFNASADGEVRTVRQGEGTAYLFVDAYGYGAPAYTRMGESVARIPFAASARGNLTAQAASGSAVIELRASLDNRAGERVWLEGDAAIRIQANGSGYARRYRFGEGAAVIELIASAGRSGRPDVIDTYVRAPDERYFVVPAISRERRV
ncbi:MAG: hypothetical protein CMJ75_19160 [Planctomycetaceae bacterium]|nr:hypothetical protein [Planctomycetaceae bacterium]